MITPSTHPTQFRSQMAAYDENTHLYDEIPHPKPSRVLKYDYYSHFLFKETVYKKPGSQIVFVMRKWAFKSYPRVRFQHLKYIWRNSARGIIIQNTIVTVNTSLSTLGSIFAETGENKLVITLHFHNTNFIVTKYMGSEMGIRLLYIE